MSSEGSVTPFEQKPHPLRAFLYPQVLARPRSRTLRVPRAYGVTPPFQEKGGTNLSSDWQGSLYLVSVDNKKLVSV